MSDDERNELQRLRAIAAALAASPEPLGLGAVCVFCGKGPWGAGDAVVPLTHRSTCPWRMAREAKL